MTSKASRMDDTPATLLLTRPEPQSRAFLADCEAHLGRSIPVVISPLMRIEPMGDVPDLERYATIILTSGNGVARLGSALSGRHVVTVGERTAALAREHDAEAKHLDDDVEGFLENAATVRGPALFCRGVHSRGDLAKRLAERGIEVEEAILYDQVAEPLTNAARLLLAGSLPVVAPVFSPRSAKLLSSHRIAAPLTLLAISQATADAWTGGGEVLVAERPNAAAMRALVTKAF